MILSSFSHQKIDSTFKCIVAERMEYMCIFTHNYIYFYSIFIANHMGFSTEVNFSAGNIK